MWAVKRHWYTQHERIACVPELHAVKLQSNDSGFDQIFERLDKAPLRRIHGLGINRTWLTGLPPMLGDPNTMSPPSAFAKAHASLANSILPASSFVGKANLNSKV